MRNRVKRLAEVSKAITIKEPPERVTVCWREDDLCEWPLPNGDIELITEAEFKKRGGTLITWEDIDND